MPTIQEYQKYTLTIKEASEIMKVHPDTLKRWEKKGLITPIRIGSLQERRYSNEQLANLIEKFMKPLHLSTDDDKYPQTYAQKVRKNNV